MGKAKYDWEQIRNEYVTNPEPISKQDLADRHGMSRSRLATRATKEHWDFDHDRFLMRNREQTAEKKSDAVSSFAATWDGKCADAADKLLIKVLAEIATDSKVRDVAQPLRITQDVGKVAAGESPEDTIAAILAGLQKRYELKRDPD